MNILDDQFWKFSYVLMIVKNAHNVYNGGNKYVPCIYNILSSDQDGEVFIDELVKDHYLLVQKLNDELYSF